MVADALSRITMGSVAHVDEVKKDKFHRLSRFWVRLEGFIYGGAIVHHNSESSLVVEVKFKQHLDKSLMEF